MKLTIAHEIKYTHIDKTTIRIIFEVLNEKEPDAQSILIQFSFARN